MDAIMPTAAVSATQVGMSFGSFNAITDLSFSIAEGECFGLLGPNGAGKSTMIKLIYGVMARTRGSLSVLGFDPSRDARALRRYLGVVMQEDALDEAMGVRDNMLMFCRYHDQWGAAADRTVDELLEFMSLTAKADARIFTLSGGMKRRLAFVRSLISKPKLLILDEPTTGLDPAVRLLLWDKIRELKQRGTTILLTTHYMDEAESLCDRLVVIDHGSIKAEGSPKALIKQYCPEAPEHKPDALRPANLQDVFLRLTGKDLNGQ